MRVLLQRVKRASVTIGGELHSSINKGLLVLVGIEDADGDEDIEWLAKKVTQLRIFDDENGVMNLDVKQTEGDILVVSQFTLQALTKHGNRPSYIRAAREEVAVPIYERFVTRLREIMGREVPTGVFGADMQVELINDGPVTIWIDSKKRDN
ncbi:MAG: D-tyrosyl-tRNA(Tyr) deacylase [Tidjanibacter sp.]|nr:D-tyrosyl-tRNA(Tyr) deacylase [Tidjanibacter sp.]